MQFEGIGAVLLNRDNYILKSSKGIDSLEQGLQTSVRGPNPAREAIALAHEAILSRRKDILSIMKKWYSLSTKNVLIWWNVTYPEKITLRNMSGPRTVV